MEDLIVQDENISLSEESIIQETEANTSAIIVYNQEDILISESFFLGVQIAGVMCLLSLGISIAIRMFRHA